MDDKIKQSEEEEEEARSAMMKHDTLQRGKGDRMSVMSDASLHMSSWTESERELKAGRGEMGGGSLEAVLPTHLEEEHGGNYLPEKAAQVFSPAVTVLPSPTIDPHSEVLWDSERSPFLRPQDYNQHGFPGDWLDDTKPAPCGGDCLGRDVLKMGVSLMTSALFFPLMVWGGFVFLPFDAPLLDSAPLRLVYTMRCSIFATVPIVLGWLVLGVFRLRSGATRPLFDDIVKEPDFQEVRVHQRFIADSVSLFLIYFLQLVVMAMYLSQEQLKLLPLLTINFAFGRLVYWAAAAFGSSIRGFGFGLSFLPSVAMMVANFYFIFTVEAASSVFSLPASQEVLPPPGKQRFWG
ncbi:transmembrane protein 79 [Salarias fasciatus]|uniref:Transmembrane protein 79-like n=1 Tax=Salarias fasciatus TaxID=181472 RepID=A0A672FMH0_SALFA|nr:transmembrane protein 79-like [Salarias fasciatus]